jgi:hypothetical protein
MGHLPAATETGHGNSVFHAAGAVRVRTPQSRHRTLETTAYPQIPADVMRTAWHATCHDCRHRSRPTAKDV